MACDGKKLILPVAALVFTAICAVTLHISYNDNDFYVKENNLYYAPVLTAAPEADKININTAGVSELIKLKGIGEVLAERIIEYREKYGDFADIREITAVKGIGEAVFAEIRDFISI